MEDCKSKNICGQVQIPTDDEIKALNALRLIKARVNEIKKVLSHKSLSEEDDGTDIELKRELSRLKVEWVEWVEKREKATKERMILLGHEKP